MLEWRCSETEQRSLYRARARTAKSRAPHTAREETAEAPRIQQPKPRTGLLRHETRAALAQAQVVRQTLAAARPARATPPALRCSTRPLHK